MRRLSGLGERLHELAEVVREGMAQREAELRVALGIDAGLGDSMTGESMTGDSMTCQRTRELVEDPTVASLSSGVPSRLGRAR